MAVEKKQLHTPINALLFDEFKTVCDEYGLKMNIILEAFMNSFIEGDFDVVVNRKGVQLQIKK